MVNKIQWCLILETHNFREFAHHLLLNFVNFIRYYEVKCFLEAYLEIKNGKYASTLC